MSDVECRDCKDRSCNCSCDCAFGGFCRKKTVVYKLTCKHCNKYYIGSTQRSLKERFAQHNTGVRSLLTHDKATSSYSRHMAEHYSRESGAIPGTEEIRNSTTIEILWQGSPFHCMKTYGRLNCKLCMAERVAILRACWKHPTKLLNAHVMNYEACRHVAKLHRLQRLPGTDDPD